MLLTRNLLLPAGRLLPDRGDLLRGGRMLPTRNASMLSPLRFLLPPGCDMLPRWNVRPARRGMLSVRRLLPTRDRLLWSYCMLPHCRGVTVLCYYRLLL
jgi:hypothetical protein